MTLRIPKCRGVYGWCIVAMLTLLCSRAAGSQATQALTGLHWLMAGPFPVSGENALFDDRLGGEASARPREGATAAPGIKWQPVVPNANGEFDLDAMRKGRSRSAVYAYAEISSADGKAAVITLGSGPEIQLRLNGEIMFESRLSRKPEPDRDAVVLPLQKGLNRLLIKAIGAGTSQLQFSLHEPAGKIFINHVATIVPDFRSGERMQGAWGQVEVANESGTKVKGVAVELAGSDLVLRSVSERVDIEAGEVKRIPFWIVGKSPAPEHAAGPLDIQVFAGKEHQSIDVNPFVRKPNEHFVTTYRSFVDGSVQPFSVLLPPSSFDLRKTYPLILLLHGAQVTGWGENIISYDAKEWAIQVAVHDRGNNRYRDIGEVDIDEVLAEVKRLYSIDPDRIYLAGHSMGGYGTWFQATHRPDLWASVSPQAGYTDYSLYTTSGGHDDGLPQQAFQKRLFESWSPLLFAENLLHVPAYVVHGAKDDNVVVEYSRRMAKRLKELGYNFVYDENPETGHWWGPRGKDYGIEVVDKPAIWNFLRKTERRVKSPRIVIFKTDTLHYRNAYWVTIDELNEANSFARIEAEITSPNSVEITQSNITQFTLRLDPGLVDAARPVAVRINGANVFDGVLPSSERLTLRRGSDGSYLQLLDEVGLRIADTDAAERFGRTAILLDQSGAADRVAALPIEPLKKSGQIYGPVSDAFNRPFIFVVGTRGKTAKELAMIKASRRAAEFQARDWLARADGRVDIKADSDVTPQDISSYNLILFGDPSVNSFIAQVNDFLPIKFAGSAIDAGRERFSSEGTGSIIAFPNPLNRDRYVVVVEGLDPESMETAGRLRTGDLPDYAIFNDRTLAGGQTRFAAAGFFDKYWRLQGQTRNRAE